jgi:hypothetical protein
MKPKRLLETPAIEGDSAGLSRYRQPSAKLGEVLARNLAIVTEPVLKQKLNGALDRLQRRGQCRLSQQPTKKTK